MPAFGAGKKSDLLIGSALFMLTAFFSFWAYRTYFWGGESFEFCQYAEIGRNIIEGLGFRTAFYYPSTLAYLEANKLALGALGPVVDRFPLVAYWMALFELILGVGDFAIVAANAAAHGLWAAAIFILGRRFFSRAACLWAAGAWAVHPMLIAGFDQMGHPDLLFGLLLFILNALFVDALSAPLPGAGRFFQLGLVAGLTHLARGNFILWLPVYLILLSRARGLKPSLRLSAAFLGGMAAVALPWMLYYSRALGFSSPTLFNSNLAERVLVRGIPWIEYRTYYLKDFASMTALSALALKWQNYFARFCRELPFYWNQVLVFPLALAWGLKVSTGKARTLMLAQTILLFWQAACFSLLRHESLGFMNGRYYLWFAPMILLAAGEFIEAALSRLPKQRQWAWAALILLQAGLFSWRYAGRSRGMDHPSGLPVPQWPELAWVREKTSPDALIASNIPTQITWYCRRRSFSITNTPEGMLRLLKAYPADYMLLSDTRVGEIENFPSWLAMFRSRRGLGDFLADNGYRFERVFDAGVLLKRL